MFFRRLPPADVARAAIAVIDAAATLDVDAAAAAISMLLRLLMPLMLTRAVYAPVRSAYAAARRRQR